MSDSRLDDGASHGSSTSLPTKSFSTKRRCAAPIRRAGTRRRRAVPADPASRDFGEFGEVRPRVHGRTDERASAQIQTAKVERDDGTRDRTGGHETSAVAQPIDHLAELVAAHHVDDSIDLREVGKLDPTPNRDLGRARSRAPDRLSTDWSARPPRTRGRAAAESPPCRRHPTTRSRGHVHPATQSARLSIPSAVPYAVGRHAS